MLVISCVLSKYDDEIRSSNSGERLEPIRQAMTEESIPRYEAMVIHFYRTGFETGEFPKSKNGPFSLLSYHYPLPDCNDLSWQPFGRTYLPCAG